MLKMPEGQVIPALGVIETVESDEILRWDGTDLYTLQDVYHNGQIVHAGRRRRVTREVALHIARLLGEH